MRGRRASSTLSLALAVLLLGSDTGADDRVVRIIPLKHRPAADLVEVLTPLVGREGSLSALDTRLVVRATPQALARIEAALLTLDVPLRSLMVTVSHGLARSSARESGGVGGAASAGGTTVMTSPPGPSGTATVEIRTSRTVVQGAFGAQSGVSSEDVTQQIRALEGYPALIRVGRSEPFTATGVVPTPGGPAVSTGTVFAESGTGFHVLPRLGGNFVTLELWAENTRGAGPVVEGQDLRTTVSGRLGEWIEVGRALRQAEIRAREVLGASSGTISEERSVRVRVDEVR